MAALPKSATTPATVAAIYAAYERARKDDHRPHLGASLVGHPCDRFLWLTFRWAFTQSFDGRMLRLFKTGDLQEPRMSADLRAIGCEVSDGPAPGQQWRATAVDGHFGSSIDGAALGIAEAPKAWHLLEYKTHNARSFAELTRKGVQEAKPQHYAQMIVGMHLHGFKRAFYLAVNKDTDELYGERVHADPVEAMRLLARAERVIRASEPPERISQERSWYQCRMCPAHALCHADALAERNCRTCLHSSPAPDAKWTCAKHGTCAPEMVGCGDHLYIPALVPGEQVDVIDGGHGIVYRMRDGKEWVDGEVAF